MILIQKSLFMLFYFQKSQFLSNLAIIIRVFIPTRISTMNIQNTLVESFFSVPLKMFFYILYSFFLCVRFKKKYKYFVLNECDSIKNKNNPKHIYTRMHNYYDRKFKIFEKENIKKTCFYITCFFSLGNTHY